MNKSKDIETHLITLMKKESLIISDSYSEVAIVLFKHLEHIDVYEDIYKPSVKGKKNIYGKKGSEPKTDISLNSNNINYKLSVKKDKSAYITSCNSSIDFISVFVNLLGDDLDDDIKNLLIESSTKIDKIANFFSFDKNYKDDVESFVKDKFYDKAIKYINSDNATIYSNYIINCYNNKLLKEEYINKLHESETFIQKVMNKLFNEYPDYSKRILFELVTGNIKFNNSDCSCNYIIDVDGLYKLDDYKCDYINIIYDKFISANRIGRLQNVPRKTISKKILKTNNLTLIAESFAVADLTFKI